MKFRFKQIAWIGMFFGMMTFSQARQWTNDKGQVIEADFISCDGKTVELLMAGKNLRYELSKLSQADQDFAKSQMNKPSKTEIAETGWLLDFPISKPAFTDTKQYLTGRNAKALYEAFEKGNFPDTWTQNRKDVVNEFAYTNGKTLVYVPPSYNDKEPIGVYLHVSPGDAGENITAYAPVMDRLRMIYISPKGTSNDQPLLRRVKVSIDALASVKEKWNIDPTRVCVGGLSGGGHMSMVIHAMYPEWFVGSISHAAQSYLPEGNSPGHFPGLEAGDLKSKEFKGHKWCVISGEKDQNYPIILETSLKWKAERFDYKFFDVPGMAHDNASPEKLEEALKWIGM